MAQTVSRGKKDKSGNSLIELVTIVVVALGTVLACGLFGAIGVGLGAVIKEQVIALLAGVACVSAAVLVGTRVRRP